MNTTRGRGGLLDYCIEQQLLVNHMENWPANCLDWSGVGSVWSQHRLVHLICGDKKCPRASRIQFTSARKMCGKCEDLFVVHDASPGASVPSIPHIVLSACYAYQQQQLPLPSPTLRWAPWLGIAFINPICNRLQKCNSAEGWRGECGEHIELKASGGVELRQQLCTHTL